MADRTTLQSFDWSSLNLTKEIAPELPLVALSSGDAWMGEGQTGASPNLGGIITFYPTCLRTLMEDHGLKLPKAYEL